MRLIDEDDKQSATDLRRLWSEALWGAGMVGSVILFAAVLTAAMR